MHRASRASMRLLNTFDGSFYWNDSPQLTKYAILSHVWSRRPNGEQSYQDLVKIQDQVQNVRISNPHLPKGAVLSHLCTKIRHACNRARADGLTFIWIDTCCIDKSSSAELSEAINSMYAWYSNAAVCYALLPDLHSDEDPLIPNCGFRKSIWFNRGWTLQELHPLTRRSCLSKVHTSRFVCRGAKCTIYDIVISVLPPERRWHTYMYLERAAVFV